MKLDYTIFLFLLPYITWAQLSCDGTVPTFTANLTGHRDSVWNGPSIQGNGLCCSRLNLHNCIVFTMTPGPDSISGMYDIIDISVLSGGIYRQLNSDSKHVVDQIICLFSVASHYMTFRNVDNDSNINAISSLKKAALIQTMSGYSTVGIAI